MALSISRPDPTSPASVAEASFATSRRGFDQAEVRDLLRAVAAELGRLQERERFLERELRAAQTATAPDRVELDDETVTRLLGEETLRVLQTARESASQIKIKAEEGAARILREASDEAQRVREQAEIDASRTRTDAASDADAEVSLAKQQGREMVNEARAYRERVLSELARRREVARQQIEQLVQGRDRLLQVFERARLVAVDVVSDLAPLGEPEEYVDLSPTTGPVPMMVPSTPAPVSDTAVETVSDTAVQTVDDPHPDVASDDETTDAAVPESVPDDAGGEHTNVVSLFPGAGASTDVDSLFARLRGESDTDHESAPDNDPDAVPDVEPVGETAPQVEADAPTEVENATVDVDVDVDQGPETIFDRRDADLVPLIVAGARKLKRVLADEQNGVLDTLRRREPVTTLEALLPDVGDHAAKYADAIGKELRAASLAGAGSVADATDPDVARRLAAPEALAAVHDAVRTDLVTPLRDRLERAVVDGSGDNDDITKRVRAVYREWKTQHIDDQLDDLFRLAHGSGVLAAVEPGTPLCWKVDPHGPACPDAEDNALGGVVPAGAPYPTGHVCAPAHAGCRCLLATPGQ
jgi:DivIVA domain-containing protein